MERKKDKNLDRRSLEKRFREMVLTLDGESSVRNVAGSVCEHYAIEFAKLMLSQK